MNSFFVSEGRRLGVAYYGDAVTKKLQTYCDEEAAEVLTGKQYVCCVV